MRTDLDFILIQALNGLAAASSMFLVAAGLSLIFGVTRLVNFAHGSLYMLGAYGAYSLSGVTGFWPALILAALAVGLAGALLEMLVLRRIYGAHELFQLLATFGAVLAVQDLVLIAWGPEDLLGPRAPGLRGAVAVMGGAVPAYDLFLIALGPLVLALLWLLLRRTRWGVLVRAATADREMVAALGVNQSWLFTGVFFLGALLAGLGGALQLPRTAIQHGMDMTVIVEAFAVVVIGGLGSVPGAFLASLLIGELNAFGILLFPKATLVLTFLAMALVLVVRPQGLLGRAETVLPRTGFADLPLRPLPRAGRLAAVAGIAALAAAPAFLDSYGLGVATEILIFGLFAVSLHFVTGLGGIVSFGHAAFFGLGAYGAALTVKTLGMAGLVLSPLAAGLAALVFARLALRLSGVYLAMLTLAFAQILHAAAFQWYGLTGGDNGILGVWPAAWAADPAAFYWLSLAVAGTALVLLRKAAFAPFGYGLRAGRDSPLRAEAVGIDVARQRRLAYGLAGAAAGLAGGLYAFLKGSVFPDVLAIPLSVDALVMMMLGGVQSPGGPLLGAVVYKLLQITLSAYTDYWRLIVGGIILALVLLFPQGILGMLRRRGRGA